MSHPDHQTFLDAIDGLETVTLDFVSKDDGGAQLTRACAPLDYGPSRIAKDNESRYHFWDYDSDEGPHPLVLAADQVISVAATGDTFDPGEFITWPCNWHYPRDWGSYS